MKLNRRQFNMRLLINVAIPIVLHENYWGPNYDDDLEQTPGLNAARRMQPDEGEAFATFDVIATRS